MDKIKKLIELIKESNNIVFFGGAGVSTESGLKDFRSVDGLYNEKYDYPPEEILSHTFFINKTDEFFRFYIDKLNTKNLKPNITHIVLSDLEKIDKIKAIVTQNIDGFHQEAGSKNVLEGKVAPGMDGYFDIVIDPKNTDVSIRYDLIYDII